MAGRQSKVTFDSSTSSHGDEDYLMAAVSDGEIVVNVGFLQMNHKYCVSVQVTSLMGNGVREYDQKNDNLSLTETSVDLKSRRRRLTVELMTAENMLLKEELKLINDENVTFNLLLLGQILDQGKGRPVLKKGVHSVI